MPKTKVFIAWSGDRSKAVAQVLCQWLPNIIQYLDPWMSEEIDKGKRWDREISMQLEKAQLGIICLTSENHGAPWVNFEAGALSKHLDTSRVCPYLLDLSTTELQHPLASLQVTLAEREDTRRLLHTFNKVIEEPLKESTVNSMFDTFWVELESQLSEIKKRSHAPAKPKRSTEDMLEEILATVREEGKDRGAIMEALRTIFDLIREQRPNPFLATTSGSAFGIGLASFRDEINPKLEKAPVPKRNLRSEGLDPETK